jgi:hypothetical protein
METEAEPKTVYDIFVSMGGKQGWYYADWLWKFRFWLDKLAGGVGMRQDQRRWGKIQPGDVVDGFIVETVTEGRLIRLRNEMKAPGPAWMQFEVQRSDNGKTQFIQTAFFEPHGLAGLLYWYALNPFHQLIFKGMARAILRRAES